jgi:hypothetical protein
MAIQEIIQRRTLELFLEVVIEKNSKLMGKRSDFPRRDRDYYPTPFEVAEPLFPFLKDVSTFVEPMSGDGSLVRHLETTHMECLWSSDIEPQDKGIKKQDAFTIEEPSIMEADVIITNPPWTRPILHKAIEYFINMKPTWLLFDHDWTCTKQSAPLMRYCRKIISVGRVKWIPGTKHTSKDSVCWYLFTKQDSGAPRFYGRGYQC